MQIKASDLTKRVEIVSYPQLLRIFFSPRPTIFFTNLWTELAILSSEALLRENQGKQQQNVTSTEG